MVSVYWTCYIGRQQDFSKFYSHFVLNHAIWGIYWEAIISSTSSFVNSTMGTWSLTFSARIPIVEFTDEDAEEIGGFPVNSPDCMVQDQSVDKTWKNFVGVCNTFNKRKPSRQNMDGFMNDIHSSFENIRHEKIQPKLIFGKKSLKRLLMWMVVIKHTWYLQKGGNDFYEMFK